MFIRLWVGQFVVRQWATAVLIYPIQNGRTALTRENWACVARWWKKVQARGCPWKGMYSCNLKVLFTDNLKKNFWDSGGRHLGTQCGIIKTNSCIRSLINSVFKSGYRHSKIVVLIRVVVLLSWTGIINKPKMVNIAPEVLKLSFFEGRFWLKMTFAEDIRFLLKSTFYAEIFSKFSEEIVLWECYVVRFF